MRTVAIVNPSAGGGRAARRAAELGSKLPGLEVRTTRGPGHATELARAARADGAEVVVAAGGDGTLFEVVNGLVGGDGPPPALGILAVGTGNSFVRDVGLSDPERAIEAIRDGRRRKVDLLRIVHAEGELWSINLVSLGFSAEAGDLTNRRFKGMGAVGYVSAVLASLIRLHPSPIPYALDDGEHDARPLTLLSLCNSSCTGGAMRMAPGADPSDGELDVVRVGPMGRRRLLSVFPRIFRGTHVELPEVSVRRARKVTFAPTGARPVLIDGEVRSIELRSVAVVPRALEVCA
jgi:diacylglycerol kinase (ATP)